MAPRILKLENTIFGYNRLRNVEIFYYKKVAKRSIGKVGGGSFRLLVWYYILAKEIEYYSRYIIEKNGKHPDNQNLATEKTNTRYNKPKLLEID